MDKPVDQDKALAAALQAYFCNPTAGRVVCEITYGPELSTIVNQTWRSYHKFNPLRHNAKGVQKMNATVYTEDTEFTPRAVELASRFFDGFTVTKGLGYWQGKRENGVQFHFVRLEGGDDREHWVREVKSFAHALRTLLKQQAVLVSFSEGEVYLAEKVG